MRTEEKRALTSIGKDPFFRDIMEKLTTDAELKHSEKVYILSCAILFLKQYAKDNRYTSYDGFWSHYENDVDKWLETLDENIDHKLGSMLEFLLEFDYRRRLLIVEHHFRTLYFFLSTFVY